MKQNEESKSEGLPFDLRLRSLKSSKQSFARLLRERAKGNIDDKIFRSMVWGMNIYLGYLKTEAESDFQERLKVIESQLSEMENEKHDKKRMAR